MIRSEVEFLIIGLSVHVVIALQDRLDLQQQYFAVEGLCDIIIGAKLVTLDNIFLHGLGAEKEQWDIRIHIANLFRQCEAVHMGHHDIEEAKVESLPLKSSQPQPAVPFEGYIKIA